MEKYLKINTPLNYNGGFSSNESILRVTNYAVTQNYNLVTGNTLPMQTATGKTINVNFQIYKSLEDFTSGESPINPLNFPYSINKAYSNEEVHNLVKAELTFQNYDAIILTGGTAV